MNRTLIASLLALSLNVAFAADIAAPEPTDKLASARAQISAKNWAGAIDELKRVNDTGSADWNNLMGYSLRKQKTPDLAGSEKYYNEALRIDPKHRGTLEYSGELYLMKGDLATAEQRLATLEKVCGTSCAEYNDLKGAIARYKASGNKSSGY
ncbi:tetratricopeptide repeat protein [Sphaerotilaceae bacterium SBD11-9]